MIKKKVLIFGASGQIGRYCIRRLVKDNYKIVDYLIKKGAHVNNKDMNFSTPIFNVRSLDILQLLIENKAIINEPDVDGSLPIHKIINRKCDMSYLLDTRSPTELNTKLAEKVKKKYGPQIKELGQNIKKDFGL